MTDVLLTIIICLLHTIPFISNLDPLTIKFLCLIHTFQWAIKLHLLTESFIAENTKKKKKTAHTHLLCLLMNTVFIMFQSLALTDSSSLFCHSHFRYMLYLFRWFLKRFFHCNTRMALHLLFCANFHSFLLYLWIYISFYIQY